MRDFSDRIDPTTRDLLSGWLLFAVGAAGVAGILAVFIAMARIPALQTLTTAESFYVFLVGHVTFSLIIWLLAFVIIATIYTGGVFLGRGGSRTAPTTGGFWLSVLGSGVLLAAVLMGNGDVILSDYVPVLEAPLFFAGYALFIGGIALSIGYFLSSVLSHRGRPLPLPLYGMTSVAVCVVITIVALLTGIATVGSRSYHALFWGAGHALQYVYVGVLSVAWYILAASAFGAAPAAPRMSRLVFALYPMLALPIPFLYLLFDPMYLPKMTSANTFLGLGLGLPTFMHALLVAISVIRVSRRVSEKCIFVRPGVPTNSLCEFVGWARARTIAWFRQAFRKPEASALVLSMLLFLIGGLLAPVGARNTLRVTAHYHAMLVGGVTLAFMGLAYHLLTEMGLGLNGQRLARVQPYVFGLGVLITVLTLAWAGALGAPRKTFESASAVGSAWTGAMNLMALGAGLAALGGAIFVVVILVSLIHPRADTRLIRAPEIIPRS